MIQKIIDIAKSNIYGLILYIIFFIFVYAFSVKECEDLFSNKTKNREETCYGDGCGRYLYDNRYKQGDSLDDIKVKLYNLSCTNEQLPKWRRALILSTLISFVISVVVYKRVVDFPTFFLYGIISFMIINFSFNFYSFHYDRFAVDYVSEHLEKLNTGNKKRNTIFKKTGNKFKKDESKNTKNSTPNMV